MSELWIVWAATFALGAILGVWWMLTRRVLPLERQLAEARELARSQEASAKELRQSQERLEGSFTVLQQVAATISGHPSQPAEMLGAVVSIVARAMEADLCAFLLFDEPSGELVTQPGAFGLGEDEGSLYRVPVTNHQSSSVRVFLSGEPFITGDAQNDPRVQGALSRLWRCHSLLVVPLTLESKRIGVMRVGSFRSNFFTPDHIRLSAVIAEEAVVLVESAMLNRKLSEANQRLSEINRLKDDFVSTVSHEFKTPLTSIKGFLSVLLDGEVGPVNEEQMRFLKIAKSAADRLTDLVSDLLDLAKLESGARMDFVPIELRDMMEQCEDDHAPLAEVRQIKLKLEAPAQPIHVRGDPRWIRQLLDNLLSNALKFTRPNGTVVISAAAKGETAVVTVQDDGIGIALEDQQRVFEKFYRASNRSAINAPGTGLGLAIAKFIIDKHEGRIWVESEPGKGSRFHVALPISREAPAGEAPTESNGSAGKEEKVES
ncbi:MAG: GAF domain-containing sensor histidine kinase [Elusimicrobia bacterium]|nr:GAF domain-containing sensor histidine kinase [Elusimicrobiota bacterium]